RASRRPRRSRTRPKSTSSERRRLTSPRAKARLRCMSLLARERNALVSTAQLVRIHGDAYVDLVVTFPDEGGGSVSGRLPLWGCRAALRRGDAVAIRFVMNVMVSVRRA